MMETRSAKRKRLLLIQTRCQGSDRRAEDRLSDLPDAVLYHILFLLPIKSVAQTSVLSRRWRQLWYSFPDLDFTTLNPFTIPSPLKMDQLHSWVSIGADSINRILDLRRRNSPIRALRFRAHITFSRLNRLIRRAVNLDVQELDIEVATADYFNFPRSVISCDTLRVFKLKSRYPGFRFPPSAVINGGFQSLQTLSLSFIILNDQPSLVNVFTDSSFPMLKKLNLDRCKGLMHLSVSCRALEELGLEQCCQMERLEVVGPKLERLRVVECFDSYSRNESWVKIDALRLQNILWSDNTLTDRCCLQNLGSLREAFVGFFILSDDLSEVKLQSVSHFLSGIASSRSLILDYLSIQILSRNNHIAGVSLCGFNKLKSLELRTGLSKHIIPELANLFRGAPAIHTLIIKIERSMGKRGQRHVSSRSVGEEYWESQREGMKGFLEHLGVVKIHGVTECENETISFVKFVLKHGNVLQELMLYGKRRRKSWDYSLVPEKLKSQILGFSRASCNAKIAFY